MVTAGPCQPLKVYSILRRFYLKILRFWPSILTAKVIVDQAILQLPCRRLPTCFYQKKPDLVPKNPDTSFKALIHKLCITKHKTDVKTRPKHRYNTITLFKKHLLFPYIHCRTVVSYQ